jgi:hypothetical protein
MSYAVVRMVKLKSHDLKGIQFHNQREKESKTNPDIDKSKSPFNYDHLNSNNIDYNKQVKKIIEDQKEGTRKIRKDAVLVNEFLVTSDKPFFKKLSPLREKEFFKESTEFFMKRYGEQNIVFATVHIDEKTPHMHIGVVPMRDGKLQGKNVFNRQELLAIQEEFPKHMKEKGFDLERGELGSTAEHIEIQRLKAITVREEVKTLEKTREGLKSDVEGLIKAVTYAKDVDELETAKTSLMGKSAKLPLEDYNQLKTKAKATELYIHESVQHLEKVVQFEDKARQWEKKYENSETEIKQLRKIFKESKVKLRTQFENENGQLKNEIKELKDEVHQEKTENEKLKKQIVGLQKINKYLENTIKTFKGNALKHLSVAVEKVQELFGKARMDALKTEYGKEKMNEKDMEISVPEDERKGAEFYLEFFRNTEKEKAEKESEAEFRRKEQEKAEKERSLKQQEAELKREARIKAKKDEQERSYEENREKLEKEKIKWLEKRGLIQGKEIEQEIKNLEKQEEELIQEKEIEKPVKRVDFEIER